MFEMIVAIALGLLGGVAVGIQSPISGIISERLGGATSSFVIHISGAIASGILLVLRGGEKIQEWRTVPWYMFGIGTLGLVFYLTLSYTIPKLGPTSALTLVIVGQLSTGLLLEYFGWFGFPVRELDVTRLAGIILLLAGSYLIIK